MNIVFITFTMERESREKKGEHTLLFVLHTPWSLNHLVCFLVLHVDNDRTVIERGNNQGGIMLDRICIHEIKVYLFMYSIYVLAQALLFSE